MENVVSKLIKANKESNFVLAEKIIKNLNFKETSIADIKEIINVNPFYFEYLNDEYKSNKDLALKALSLSGLVLKYVSEELKNDVEVVRVAFGNNKLAINLIGKNFNCPKSIIAYLSKNTNYMYYLSDNIKNHKDIMLKLIKAHNYMLLEIGDELKTNRDFLLKLNKFMKESDISKYDLNGDFLVNQLNNIKREKYLKKKLKKEKNNLNKIRLKI